LIIPDVALTSARVLLKVNAAPFFFHMYLPPYTTIVFKLWSINWKFR